jgi:apolipoprotein N-acyltransferase
VAVDYEGNVLASTDFFTADPQVMVAYVPMQGVHTIYANIGDLLAWLSIAGLVGLIVVAITRRRPADAAGEAAPRIEALTVS